MRILYFFSKTDVSLIHHCPATTRNIHASLGFFVLITGIMALLSGTYAISNMFIHEDPTTGRLQMMQNGWLFSILLGTVYASFIMAIDREIVSAGSKWAALLRLPLALIIGLVVAVPVEMQIFEARINKQLTEEGRAENDSLFQNLEKRNRIGQLETDIGHLDSLRLEAIRKKAYWVEVMEAEAVGRVGSGRTGIAGRGEAYDEAKQNRDLQDQYIKDYARDLQERRGWLDRANAVKDSLYSIQRMPQSYDLLSKYIALKQVKEADQTGSAGTMAFAVTLLFCLFELIPSLMKLFTPETEYDTILDKRRRLNMSATKIIYQKVFLEYGGMEVNEIRTYNPVAVKTIYESQSV